jgi:hypothetical protein
MRKLLDKIQFWLALEPHHIEQGIHEIAMSGKLPVKTIEPKRPSCYLAWVRFMQRYNKTIIKL